MSTVVYLEHGLHGVGRQGRTAGRRGTICFQHQRDRARRHGGSHARSAEPHVVAIGGLELRVRLVQGAVLRRHGDDVVTGRDDIRLHVRVVPRGPGGAVVWNSIVVARDGVVGSSRADGNRRRRVAGGRDPGISGLARCGVLAVVACCGHHDDARAARTLDGLHEGIGCRGFGDGVAEREVEEIDAKSRLVRDGEVDRPNDVARVARAVLVEHLQRHDADLRCQAAVRRRRRQRARAADAFLRRACHVRSRRTERSRRSRRR